MHDDALYQILHQDPDAGMKILIDQYAGLVSAVVQSKLSPCVFCAADIEHCIADVFSEFYCDLDKYDPKRSSIRAWLCVIAKHNALDRLRNYYSNAGAVSLDDGGSRAQPADNFSIEEDLEDRDTRSALIKAVKNLGEPDREILIRKFYLAQSSKEIADKLKMTVSNVDTRTHRAIQKLREQFGGDWS